MPWLYNVFTGKFDYYAYGDLDDLGDVTIVGAARGDILRRGAAAWNNYALGAAGQRLEAGALDPAWLWPDSLQNATGNIVTSTAAGIVALPRQSYCHAYINLAATQTIPNAVFTKVILNGETADTQNEFNSTSKSGTADATQANKLHDADGGFAASDVGATIWNTTDHTYTTVSGFVDSGELDLTDDIMVNGENYRLFHARYTATEPGNYMIAAGIQWTSPVASKRYAVEIKKNGAQIRFFSYHAAATITLNSLGFAILALAATDYIELFARQDSGGNEHIAGEDSAAKTCLTILKVG